MAKSLDRKALYNLVWSKPMTAAAKNYGLSDRGLAKLCERNSIPVPPRGYWAKKAAGQKVKKAPLIVLDKEEPETIILLRKAHPVAHAKQEKPSLPESVQEAIVREKLVQNRIKVPATMHKPHPIVAQWVKIKEQDVQDAKRYEWNWRQPITSLDRRKWRITSCLFKELEARGFKIVEEGRNQYQKELWIVHEQDRVSFHITERIKQYRRKITEEEKKDRLYSNQKWRQERENTGKLEITLDGEHSYPKVKIQEDEATPFEETLNEVIIKLIETMWTSKCRRLEREESERRRREEEHARYERKCAAEKQEQRKLNLEYKALSWKRAESIRDYITAVERARNEGRLQIDENEFNIWRLWALTHADGLDFITNGDPLIALSEDPEKLYSKDERQHYSAGETSSWFPNKKWYHW